MRAMACFSLSVLLASTLAGRARANGWRVDQTAGRQALARGELGLASELLASALVGAGVHPGRAAVLEDLFAAGVLLADEGEVESSIATLRLALAGRQDLYGADTPDLEPHLTLLGTLELRTRGRRARDDRRQAVEHLEASRRILERTHGSDDPAARQVAALSVEALREAGRRPEAEALSRALEARQGESAPATAEHPERSAGTDRPSRSPRASVPDAGDAQLRRLGTMREELARRRADEAAAIRGAPSGRPGMVLPDPPAEEVTAAALPPVTLPSPRATAPPGVAAASAGPPRAPVLPSVQVQAAADPLAAQLERYRRVLQAHEGWVRQASRSPGPAREREDQALQGLAELEELSYQADRLRLEATLDDRADVTTGIQGLEQRIEGLLPAYGSLAGGLEGAL